MKTSPALKGIITGALMISVILLTIYQWQHADTRLPYIVYSLYAIGIVWTLVSFRNTPEFTGTFSNLFSQGFRCFIVVTLIMALFDGIFNYSHPEYAEDSAKEFKEQLEQSVTKNEILPTEVDEKVASYKKQFIIILVSVTIFRYLIIGVVVTAAISVFLIKRKE